MEGGQLLRQRLRAGDHHVGVQPGFEHGGGPGLIDGVVRVPPMHLHQQVIRVVDHRDLPSPQGCQQGRIDGTMLADPAMHNQRVPARIPK